MQYYKVPNTNIIPGQNVFVNGGLFVAASGWTSTSQAIWDKEVFDYKHDLVPLLHFRLNDIYNYKYWSNSGNGTLALNPNIWGNSPSTGQTGLFYNCVYFNGINIQSNPNSTIICLYISGDTSNYEFSVSLWFKLSSIFNKDFNLFTITNSSAVRLRIFYDYSDESFYVSGTTFGNEYIRLPYDYDYTYSDWSFLCFSRNGNSDGLLVVGNNNNIFSEYLTGMTGSLYSDDQDEIWICQDNRNGYSYTGYCMDVRIYDRALTYGEISSLYNFGYGTFHQDYICGYPTVRDPLHWYKLNDIMYSVNTYKLSNSGYLSSILSCSGFTLSNYRQTMSGVTCTHFTPGDVAYNIYSSPQTGIRPYSQYDFYGFDELTSGFTVTMWIYEGSSTRTTRYYISNRYLDSSSFDLYGDSTWSISQNSSGDLQFEYNSNTVSVTMDPNWIQRWTFVAGWYDGIDIIRLYYSMGDKLENPRETTGVSPRTLRNGILIGSEVSDLAGGTLYNGCDDTYMYDIRIFDYALSLDELYNVYNYGYYRIYPKSSYYNYEH